MTTYTQDDILKGAKLSVSDKFDLKINKTVFTCRIYNDHISVSTPRGENNGAIFKSLGLTNREKNEFCEYITGIKVKTYESSNYWPEFRGDGDKMEGMTKLIKLIANVKECKSTIQKWRVQKDAKLSKLETELKTNKPLKDTVQLIKTEKTLFNEHRDDVIGLLSALFGHDIKEIIKKKV